jgi:parallel beta-helix repeat protein
MLRLKKARNVKIILILLMLLFGFANYAQQNANAGTPVSGNIISNTTWTEPNSPYWVEDNVTVQPGINLTIEPGVEVRFNGYYKLLVWGNLTAIGDPLDRIVFTSNKSSPIIRDWSGIIIRGDGFAQIEYCNISYANIGIDIGSSSNNSIVNNTIMENYNGIDVTIASGFNIISHNNISYNDNDGITMGLSSNTSITNNDIISNNITGIDIFQSSNNTIAMNNITDHINGIYLWNSVENRLGNNTLFFNNRSISLFLAPNNTIIDNDIMISDDVGISLISSFDNVISGNNISNNLEEGISVDSSHRTIINNNNFSSNSLHCIFTTSSADVRIFHNNFYGIPPFADDNTADTIYNESYWNGGGNYWSNYWKDDIYKGPNQDILGSDGIGDDWYWLDGDSLDYYPLMYPVGTPLPDFISPSIDDLQIIPTPQEVHNNVNISAEINDNDVISGSWINIRNPDASSLGNYSMNYDPISDRYFRNDTYQMVGTYSFEIWTTDSSDNWNSSSGQFTIVDNTNPIADAGPDQIVEQGSLVTFNGSASWDNYAIDGYLWQFADGSTVSLSGITETYEFNNTGDFEVTLTVADASGNSDSDTVWINVTENTSPPLTPTNLTVTTPSEKGKLVLTWDANTESDLAGYNIYRSLNPTGSYAKINQNVVTSTSFMDSGLSDGTTYYYKISAIDSASNESPQSDWESGTTMVDSEPPADNLIWIFLFILIVIIVLLIMILLWRRKKRESKDE